MDAAPQCTHIAAWSYKLSNPPRKDVQKSVENGWSYPHYTAWVKRIDSTKNFLKQ